MNFFFALLSLALCGLSLAAETEKCVPAGKPYTYKTSAGEERLMEIYFPPDHDPAQSKVPGMILFHGGGWTGGGLGQFRHACAYFASRGLVCATAEYQLPDKATIAKLPKGQSHKRLCVTDAKSAIRWFRNNAAELGLDPDRIITGGGSAGGHVSAIATMNPGLNDPAGPHDIDTGVVAYVWFNPAFSAASPPSRCPPRAKHSYRAHETPVRYFGQANFTARQCRRHRCEAIGEISLQNLADSSFHSG